MISNDVAASDGSCRLFEDTPLWDGGPTAAVGQFACPDAASGQIILEEACTSLRDRGFRNVLGPMDGDTWHRYRLVSWSDGTPPFTMEPTSGPYDLDAFVAAGFSVVSEYVSAITSLDHALAGAAAATGGAFSVESWNGDRSERLLDRLHTMSLSAFAKNKFYRPISREEFGAIYAPVMRFVDPNFVLFALDAEGADAGFLFGLPNLTPGYTHCAILKTYASLRRGVGRVLAEDFHRRARNRGFTHAIHALMHVDNVSSNRSGLYESHVFRRYLLMGRHLA